MFKHKVITRFFIYIWIAFNTLSESAYQIHHAHDIDRSDINVITLGKTIIPTLEGRRKGEAGKIGIIGGSTEYSGAPYFAAMTALKVGADLVYIITTESAAPVIKSYSPDLIVYLYLRHEKFMEIRSLLTKMDVVIIGPGLGREDDTLTLIYDIIDECKQLRKPLVIDADGLYAISMNISIIKDYPSPGAILTPNHLEARRLKQAMPDNSTAALWFYFWGENVAVLVKGEEDQYFSRSWKDSFSFDWTLAEGGSGRRVGGQGDILAGALGTFYNWALKSNIHEKGHPAHVAQSVCSYAAARFTRMCNLRGFSIHGRSMTASDMLNTIHSTFVYLFEDN